MPDQQKTISPYGGWASPITADMIAAGSRRFGNIATEGDTVYWVESRPAEKGRNTLMCKMPGAAAEELIPAPHSVGSRVHEYGGAAFVVDDSIVWFSDRGDGGIYRRDSDGIISPVFQADDMRFADIQLDKERNRLIVIGERQGDSAHDVENFLASITLDATPQMIVLREGNDFYASPSLNADSGQLAWLEWQHPDMPWDATELWLADIAADGQLSQPRQIAGGQAESVFQPQWGKNDQLLFSSDRSGWWNLHAYQDGQVENLYELDAEFALPQWVFGMSVYGVESEQSIISAYHQQGVWKLCRVYMSEGRSEVISLPFCFLDQVRVGESKAWFFGATATQPLSLIELDLESLEHEVVRMSSDAVPDPADVALAQPVSFPVGDDEQSHGFFYAPQNARLVGPEDEKPPLIVMGHGGPTAATDASLVLKTQFWTSRGFAVLDVNYRGSTGFGRAYRESLNRRWGLADVEDCVSGALWLAEKGWVDRERLLIRGGSAGGFTVLAALTFYDEFRAGASLYGIGDLEALARDTHKFEAHYLDRLIGPYPEDRQTYLDRSPLYFTDQLSVGAIFIQGDEDVVVPPEQAEKMVEALREKGLPVAYLLLEGEGHGFRQAANISRALEVELDFYRQVLEIHSDEALKGIAVENI